MAENYKIVHVDDNSLFLDLFRMIIDQISGINIDYKKTTHEKQALDFIESEKPDLFISDLMLENDYDAEPGINLIKRISEKYPELKIMVLSAREDQSLKQRLKHIIYCYETKEFDPVLMADKIKNILTGETNG